VRESQEWAQPGESRPRKSHHKTGICGACRLVHWPVIHIHMDINIHEWITHIIRTWKPMSGKLHTTTGERKTYRKP
jgi:hypothetical protein